VQAAIKSLGLGSQKRKIVNVRRLCRTRDYAERARDRVVFQGL
jgi:hypothetical protein